MPRQNQGHRFHITHQPIHVHKSNWGRDVRRQRFHSPHNSLNYLLENLSDSQKSLLHMALLQRALHQTSC